MFPGDDSGSRVSFWHELSGGRRAGLRGPGHHLSPVSPRHREWVVPRIPRLRVYLPTALRTELVLSRIERTAVTEKIQRSSAFRDEAFRQGELHRSGQNRVTLRAFSVYEYFRVTVKVHSSEKTHRRGS